MPTEFGKPKVAGDLEGNCLCKKNGSQRMDKNGFTAVLDGELRSWEILEIIREEEHIPELLSLHLQGRTSSKVSHTHSKVSHTHTLTHFVSLYPFFWTSVPFYQYLVSANSFAHIPARSCLATSVINAEKYLFV